MSSLKAQLTTPDRAVMNTAPVSIDGFEEPLIVRGLTRYELDQSQKFSDDRIKQEQYILARCIVGPETWTEGEVEAWQKSGGFMEIEVVARKINDLSGIGKAAAKSGVPGDGN